MIQVMYIYGKCSPNREGHTQLTTSIAFDDRELLANRGSLCALIADRINHALADMRQLAPDVRITEIAGGNARV